MNIVDVLSHLYNKSIMSGVFPALLKKAEVIPLHKKGDKQNLNNYRPISILSTFSKIFEKLINQEY